VSGRRLGPVSHLVAVLAMNRHAVTEACLRRVRESGYAGPLLLVDNGSDPPLVGLAGRWGCGHLRFDSNRYVNPVCNEMLASRDAEVLTLLNNDCLPCDGWLDEAPRLLREHGLALVAPAVVRVPHLLAFRGDLAAPREPAFLDRDAVRQGHLMTIDLGAYRQCGTRIPPAYRIWYGDDWIWGQLRSRGLACACATNRFCIAERQGTIDGDTRLGAIIEAERRRAARDAEMERMCVHSGSWPASAVTTDEPQALRRARQERVLDVLRRRWSPPGQ
jgi:hypothetical protein